MSRSPAEGDIGPSFLTPPAGTFALTTQGGGACGAGGHSRDDLTTMAAHW